MKVTDEMVFAALGAYFPNAIKESVTVWSDGDMAWMRAALEAALVAALQPQEELTDALLLPVQLHLQDALRIPTKPWPDAAAHGHEATGRAVHAAYCALRFKVMDAMAALTAARCGIALQPSAKDGK